jgi:hypothetical protein
MPDGQSSAAKTMPDLRREVYGFTGSDEAAETQRTKVPSAQKYPVRTSRRRLSAAP